MFLFRFRVDTKSLKECQRQLMLLRPLYNLIGILSAIHLKTQGISCAKKVQSLLVSKSLSLTQPFRDIPECRVVISHCIKRRPKHALVFKPRWLLADRACNLDKVMTTWCLFSIRLGYLYRAQHVTLSWKATIICYNTNMMSTFLATG
jgi:hypothetical protein